MEHGWLGPRLGLSGYFFKNRNLNEFAQTCVGLGLSGVDLWPWNVNNYTADEAAAILESYSLKVLSVNVPGSLFRLGDDFTDRDLQKEVKSLINLAQACSTSFLQMYCASPQSGNCESSGIQLVSALRKFRSVVGGEIGVLLENNLDQRREDALGINPSRNVKTLVTAIQELGDPHVLICFDAANCVAAGHDPLQQFYEAKNFIGLVHVKDCERYDAVRHLGRREATFLLRDFLNGDFLPTVVGSGEVHWGTLIPEMTQHFSTSESTWAIIDPFIDPQLVDWWCIQSVAAWRALLAK